MAMAEIIRAHVAATEIASGGFLPPERELAHQHGMDKNTVRRAFRALQQEGLVDVVPRRGYRVTARAKARAAASRLVIAFVPVELQNVQVWGPTPDHLFIALRQVAIRRGWSLLSMAALNRSIPDILMELRASRVAGVVLDNVSPELVAAIQAAGIPVVAADAWYMDRATDSIMQDGELGGFLAVRHLLDQKCRNIAWFGFGFRDANDYPNTHCLDRYHGVHTGLVLADRQLAVRVKSKDDVHPSLTEAHALLGRRPRPDGIIALWMTHAAVMSKAAREEGLKLSKDLHVVGWCMEETLDFFRAAFQGGPLPPYITWSGRVMAEAVLARLGERIRQPDLPPMRIKIPVRLVVPAKAGASGGDAVPVKRVADAGGFRTSA